MFGKNNILSLLIGTMLAGVVKEEEEFDSKALVFVENNDNINDVIYDNNKSGNGISIAERRAATCGFNVSNINSTNLFRNSAAVKSPYFTVPPGISPSVLLDSPVMFPNDQVQLSPTTGAFEFASPNRENLKLKQELVAYGNSPFTTESSTKPHSQGFTVSKDLRGDNENHVQLFEEFKCPMDLQEIAKKNSFVDSLTISESLGNKPWSETESLTLLPSNNAIATNQMLASHNDPNGKERSKNQNRDKQQKGSSSVPKEVAKYSEDGYYWRKYGQKQVKGSEYPRSYFKCTNTNCQVKKKVERSHDGQITEIVYKGSHNHPKPQHLKRFGESSEINGAIVKAEGEVTWRTDGSDSTFSASLLNDFSDPLSKTIETIEAQELSSTFGSQDGEEKDEASRDSISFNDDDDENGECEPKRRKRESFANETSTMSRSNREPRVVVQIESEIDILDDGYRWRKYGQKVVKGNPNPRSYYKCTTPGCPVRKHVERAANDIKSVITTYEGKHNHEVPSSKNGSLTISDVANLPSTVTNNTSLSTSTPQKPDHLPKTGKQSQDLPLYMELKPFLNYTDFMRSNLPGNFPPGHDLNFGTSSIYPLSFPPFPSIPYNSLLLNGNHMNTYPGSSLYPMLPDYMSMPLPMNHVPGSGDVPPLVNNYSAVQSSFRGQEVYKECQPKILKPKPEQKDDGGLYDASSLSIPNHGNGPI